MSSGGKESEHGLWRKVDVGGRERVDSGKEVGCVRGREGWVWAGEKIGCREGVRREGMYKRFGLDNLSGVADGGSIGLEP